MTSAEYRATLAPQKPITAPKTQQRVDTSAAGSSEPVAPVMGLAGKQAQYYVGPYQLAVANGTHYPGRSRVVIVGPACEELTAALVAALESFTKQPK